MICNFVIPSVITGSAKLVLPGSWLARHAKSQAPPSPDLPNQNLYLNKISGWYEKCSSTISIGSVENKVSTKLEAKPIHLCSYNMICMLTVFVPTMFMLVVFVLL